MKRRPKMTGLFIVLLMMIGYGGFQPALAAEEGISLTEAIRMALANPYNLGAYGAGVTEAEAQVAQADAARWPSVSLSTNYTKVGPYTTIEMNYLPDPSGGFNVLPTPKKVDGTGTYSTGINFQFPLYMGGKLTAAADLAQLGLDGAELNYQTAYENLVYQIVQAYVGVLKADGMLALTRDQIKLLSEHQRLIETNLNLGYATQSDLMETKIRLTQAELGAVRAEHGKKLALENLCTLLGIPPQDLVLTSKPALAAEHELPELETVIRRAETNRPELKNLALAVRSAEANLELARGYWKPNLVMIGAYEAQNPDYPSLKDAVWRFTLNLDWKFFDAGAGKAGVQQAEANLEKLRFQLAQTKDLIQLEVRQKYLAVTEAAQVLSLTKLSLSQAEENYMLQKAKFELGVATNLELLTAQNTLNAARNDYLNAEYDYFLAVAALYHALGETEDFMLEVRDDA